LRQVGKRGKEWPKIRKQWFKDNPRDWYVCYLCNRSLMPEDTTLDHVIPKSNARNFAHRHDSDNLKPCCWTCNGSKGSKHLT